MEQLSLLDENSWEKEWEGMPEYNLEVEEKPAISMTFKFKTEEEYQEFKEIVKERLYDGENYLLGMQRQEQKIAWDPLKEKRSSFEYFTTEKIQPQFPVFVVSKGRSKRNPTTKALQEMGVNFTLICEQDEFLQYTDLVGYDNVLILPKRYKENYDTFWDDNDKRTGPGPARNFAWDFSVNQGFDFHWVLDDNIEKFERLNENKKIKCTSGAWFKCQEDFVLKYKNVALAGPAYSFFVPASDARPAFKINTRIYSCLLIKNDLPFQWRGRYNEDTYLSLRAMKENYCTVQFNAFLQDKRTTQALGGGNTAEFYDEEGTKNKSQMLVDMHPDCAELVWKFNRWHHHVDYKRFFNELERKSGSDSLPFYDFKLRRTHAV